MGSAGEVPMRKRPRLSPGVRSQRILKQAVAQGLLRHSALTADFSPAHAPLLYLIVNGTVSPAGVEAAGAGMRDAHRDMMPALLRAH